MQREVGYYWVNHLYEWEIMWWNGRGDFLSVWDIVYNEENENMYEIFEIDETPITRTIKNNTHE